MKLSNITEYLSPDFRIVELRLERQFLSISDHENGGESGHGSGSETSWDQDIDD